MESDTGAAVSIIPEELYESKLSHLHSWWKRTPGGAFKNSGKYSYPFIIRDKGRKWQRLFLSW